jgi:hypothetical protein
MGPLPLARIFSLKGGVIRLVMFERGFGRVFGPLGVEGEARQPGFLDISLSITYSWPGFGG